MLEMPFLHNMTVAVLGGRRFEAVKDYGKRRGGPPHWILWTLPGEDAPDIDGFTRTRHGRYERRLFEDEIDALYSDRMYFTWRDVPFLATSIRHGDDTITGHWLGGSVNWAQENGLNGNQYDGFNGRFPLDEVDDVHVIRTDLVTKQTERLNPPDETTTERRES